MRSSRLGLLLFVCLLIAALGAACGSSSGGSTFNPGQDASMSDGNVGDGAGSSSGGDGPNLFSDATGGDGTSGLLVISPANTTIVVQYGQQSPTVPFTATENGAAVHASFAIDLGQIGTIVSSTGVMTPSGTARSPPDTTSTGYCPPTPWSRRTPPSSRLPASPTGN